MLVTRLRAESSGEELGQDSGPELAKDLGRDLNLLLGKERDKKRSLFLKR